MATNEPEKRREVKKTLPKKIPVQKAAEPEVLKADEETHSKEPKQTPAPTSRPSQRKLYRTENGAVIAGVCVGLGQYFGIDPVLIRLLFVLSIFVGGFGVPIYIVLWVVLPEKEDGEVASETTIQRNVADIREKTQKLTATIKTSEAAERPQNIFAIILILLGIIFMLDNFGWIHFDVFWPLILVFIGLYILTKK